MVRVCLCFVRVCVCVSRSTLWLQALPELAQAQVGHPCKDSLSLASSPRAHLCRPLHGECRRVCLFMCASCEDTLWVIERMWVLGKQNIISVLHMSISPPGSFSFSLLSVCFPSHLLFSFNLFLSLISSQQRNQVNIQSSDQEMFFFLSFLPFFLLFSHDNPSMRKRKRENK